MRLQQQTRKNQNKSTAALFVEMQGRAKSKPITWHDNNICQCLECGAILNILTHAHAARHGYKDKYEMLTAGKVKFLGKDYGQ